MQQQQHRHRPPHRIFSLRVLRHLRSSRIQTPAHRVRRASGGSSTMAGGREGFNFEQRHGKDRVARVCRAGGGRHFMVEWDVSISLFSDIVGAYARGNNSGIVATDTMKNTTEVRSFDCPTNCIIPSLNVSAGLLGFFFVKTWTKVREKSEMLKVPSRGKRNLDLCCRLFWARF